MSLYDEITTLLNEFNNAPDQVRQRLEMALQNNPPPAEENAPSLEALPKQVDSEVQPVLDPALDPVAETPTPEPASPPTPSVG